VRLRTGMDMHHEKGRYNLCSNCSGIYDNPDATNPPIKECTLCGEELCRHGNCTTARCVRGACAECAEARYERWLEDFYGGSAPQTDREREDVRRMR